MLALSLLGQINFILDGTALMDFESDKARALLIYLVIEAEQPHRREQLSAVFWPEHDERSALQNLRKTLHRLRKTLRRAEASDGASQEPAGGFLLITPQSVQFAQHSAYELDVQYFEELIARISTHRHRRVETCRTCSAWLTRTVQLYRGDFLAGFALKDCPDFDAWVALRRERLRLQALDVLSALAMVHEHQANYPAARECALRQLELEPWQESAYRQLMRALAHEGKRAAALAQYLACRKLLLQELGVEPEPETTALYEQIKVAATGMDAAARAPVVFRSMPARLNSFVGREHELAQIAELLQDPDCRLLTLIGPGGCGKTRLAVEAAKAELSSFADGACFVALAGIDSTDMFAAAVASALGLDLRGSQDVKIQVLAALRDRELLLVLDNFEHLLSAAPLVSAKLQACPRLNILVTSREPLHVYGERQFLVEPLPTPHLARAQGAPDVRAAAVSCFPAVELFVQRSQAVHSGFRIDDDNAATVGEICDRLDGLPLAIELAAARSRLFNPQTMLAQLNRRLSFLTSGAHDLPLRQQTLRRTLDWSYDLLGSDARTLLARLAVFAGSFTAAVAQAICGDEHDGPAVAAGEGKSTPDVHETLAALLDQSLLVQVSDTDGGLRFGMLETIREYAAERLAQSGEHDRLHQRQVLYYAALAEASELEDTYAEKAPGLMLLEAEHENIAAALTWSLAQPGMSDVSLRLAVAVAQFWRQRGQWNEYRAWLEQALQQAAGSPATHTQAMAYIRLGDFAWSQNDFVAARAALETSLHLWQESGNLEGTARALASLGLVAREQGDTARAMELLEQSATLYRELDKPMFIAWALCCMGEALVMQGDTQSAEAVLNESLALYRQQDYKLGVAWVLNHLGHAAQWRGEYEHATALHGESLQLFRQRDKLGVAWALNSLAGIAVAQGELSSANAQQTESLMLFDELGDRSGVAWCLDGFAAAAAVAGRPARAARLWGVASALRQAVHGRPASNDPRFEAYIAALARAQLDEAAFAQAWDEGRKMAFDEVVRYALADESPWMTETIHNHRAEAGA